jgi:sialate O-acetylesterase
MHLYPKGKASDGIDVTGEWRWNKGIATTAGAPTKQAATKDPGMHPQALGALHDGMIAPFVPYSIRGAIWYQGESNAGQPGEYRELMPLLIESWREDFGDHLAFGIVQLAAFKAVSDDPNQGDWAHLRDAQLHAVRTVPNTGLAVTTDVGNANDIHPKNKKAVGDRLAGWALHDVYGDEDAVPSSPIQAKATRDGNMVTVTFAHAQGGLKSASGAEDVGGFALAGPNGRFHWAQAKVTGKNSVQVWSNEVPDPAIVIYGWQNNPVKADLVNSAELPASPFRADISAGSSGR